MRRDTRCASSNGRCAASPFVILVCNAPEPNLTRGAARSFRESTSSRAYGTADLPLPCIHPESRRTFWLENPNRNPCRDVPKRYRELEQCSTRPTLEGICRTEVACRFGSQDLTRNRRRRYRHKQNRAPRPFGSPDLRARQGNRHAGKKRERPHGSEVMSNVEVCATYWESALAATHNMDAMAVNLPANVHGICLRDLLHEIIVCTTA